MTVSLFEYPGKHERKHAPAGYAEYQSLKPWLRDEFTFRCVYCLERERWYPNGQAGLSVDHVIAQARDARRIVDYCNTVYACARCNSAKREIGLIDPTATAFADHLEVLDDGIIRPKTVDGRKLVDLLHLNKPDPLRTRRQLLTILHLKQRFPVDSEVHKLYLAAFGYPDELPDLVNAKPPAGNALGANTTDCYFERRRRKELPSVY